MQPNDIQQHWRNPYHRHRQSCVASIVKPPPVNGVSEARAPFPEGPF